MKDKIDEELEKYLGRMISLEKDKFLSYCYSLIKEYTKGGKRLRPISLIMSFNAYKGKGNILPIALAVELYHTYTLILDDIMDEDEFRRNKPSVYKRLKDFFIKNYEEESYDGSLFSSRSKRFSACLAVMIGNMTNILSRNLILSSGFSDELKLKTLNKLEKADLEINKGQILDIEMENKKASEAEYLDMIYKKTAILFGLCFELGALLAGKDDNIQNTMKKIGEKIGLSFQIQDDLLDISGQKGRQLGTDIKKKKNTLLMIKFLEKTEIKTDNVDEIIKKMHEFKIIDYCRKKSLFFSDEAREMIKKSEITDEYKEFFLGFCNMFIQYKIESFLNQADMF
jgi:geranylgeranyl diphosphate synthase, type I